MQILHNGRALVIGLDRIGVDTLDTLSELEVIGAPSTGLDHINLAECQKRGIKIISLQEETEFLKNITSTAEHTIGLIIALSRNYKIALNTPYRDREFYKGRTLKEKTLGIIGYGRIGRQVKRIAEGLSMNVLIFDKNEPFENLQKLLKESDVVSLHITLPGNEGFFTKEMIKEMNPSAYLINTSRDQIIQKGALLWALKNKTIAGAAIDFIDDPELVEYARNHNNLILTNHIGGATYEDMKRTEEFIKQKVGLYLSEMK